MKLIIQIPCLDEEATLGTTLQALPRTLPGFDVIEWLVIDDGSTDGTVDVAETNGVDHIVRHGTRRGLAAAFATGIDACLRRGADVIVNTDGDNQYEARDIGALVAPILEGRADMVVGDRQTDQIAEFSWLKRKLEKLGSWVVGRVSGAEVPDAASGFRAFSRDVAFKLNVLSEFSYTLETVIQAGHQSFAVVHVPVRTNPSTRKSRLARSMGGYLIHSAATIVRIYAMHRPLRVFVMAGSVTFAAGFGLGVRFVFAYASGDGAGHVQSLLLAVLLMVIGFQTFITALLADLIAKNRRLAEETLWRLRRLEIDGR